MKPRFRFCFSANVPSSDAVVPRLLPDGGLECPQCQNICYTPVAWNPWNGLDERMVLVSGKTCECPHCGCIHLFPPALAAAHNRTLFPDDPRYRQGG